MVKRPIDAELRKRLREVTNDERYHYAPATTFENAPLALIQLELETTARLLAWVLGVPIPKPKWKSRRNHAE